MITRTSIKKLSSIILAIALILNTVCPITAEAADTSTYEQLKDNEFVQRLRDSGASDAQIKAFLDDIDNEILKKGDITEDNFDTMMFETLKEVIVKPKHAAVYRAMLVGFSEEIDYTLENKELHPNMIPLRDAVANIVLERQDDDPIEEPPVSKGRLISAITEAQSIYDSSQSGTEPGQYPQAAKTALYNAISSAKAVLNKAGATQSEIDAAVLTLENALAVFESSKIPEGGSGPDEEPPVSKDALTTLITEAQETHDSAVAGTNIGQYPPQAKAALSNAISAAKTTLNKAGATQSEIDAAVSQLQEALTAFESSRIKEEPGNPQDPGTPQDPGSPGNPGAPKDNDSSGSKHTAQPPEMPAAEVQSPGAKPSIVLNDIAGHWAENKIIYLMNKGAVTGYSDGSFRPDSNITRSEFIVILVKALNLEIKAGKIFKDTENHWAKDYISTAYANGFASGYGEDLCGPDDFINREQIVVMIVKAAKLTSGSGSKLFGDSAEISPWAKDAADIAVGLGIITGRPGNRFEPKSIANRAEAVTIIANMLEMMID